MKSWAAAPRIPLTSEQQQAELLQKIADHVPVMMCMIAPDGRVVWTNRRFEQTLGWSASDAPAYNIAAQLYPNPEYRREVMQFISRGSGQWAEFRTRTRSGATLHTAWMNILLSDGMNLGVGMDLTQMRNAEDVLRRAQGELRSAIISLNPAAGSPQHETSQLEDGVSAASAGQKSLDELLTVEEFRVLNLVAAGQTNKEISAALALSEKAIKCRLHRVFEKLGVRRRGEAAAVYLSRRRHG